MHIVGKFSSIMCNYVINEICQYGQDLTGMMYS